MNRRTKMIVAAAVGIAAVLGGAGAAYAMMQSDGSAQLRASGQVGEQADGYLGIVAEVKGEETLLDRAINRASVAL